MDNSLPALSRFTYPMSYSATEELGRMIKKHGHKFQELKLKNCHVLNILDACPALNFWTFAMGTEVGQVGLVCSIPLASV
jgi:hypothetical protein